jgi:hypothetical protein
VASTINVNDFDNYVSLGFFCEATEVFQQMGLRKASGPFDWVISDKIDKVFDLIENNFIDLFNPEYFFQRKDNLNIYVNSKYSIGFVHDFTKYASFEKQLPAVEKKYRRRIKRFYEMVKQPTLFLRYVSSQDDANYLSHHYCDLLNLLRSFNPGNDIIFIINNDCSISNIVNNVFFVRKDDHDSVARYPLQKSFELRLFFKNLNQKKVSIESINKYEEIQKKKKPSFIKKCCHKAYRLLQVIFLRVHKYSKQC